MARASSDRAPLRMLIIAWLPSWQAYSQSSPAVTPREAWSVVMGADAVHARSKTSGSSSVNV